MLGAVAMGVVSVVVSLVEARELVKEAGLAGGLLAGIPCRNYS